MARGGKIFTLFFLRDHQCKREAARAAAHSNRNACASKRLFAPVSNSICLTRYDTARYVFSISGTVYRSRLDRRSNAFASSRITPPIVPS